MTVWLRRLSVWFGIGVAEGQTTEDHLAVSDRRLDRLEARVRALEADVAARVDIETRDDSADAAARLDYHGK